MKKSVMIVDDDSFVRMAVRELFKFEGINVIEADGAQQCIDTLKHGFTGIILMDVMMPKHDGWDTIRMIVDGGHYKQRNMLIVMLTARDVPDEKMDGLQAYVTDYITKPFENDSLLALVKDHFQYIGHEGSAGNVQ